MPDLESIGDYLVCQNKDRNPISLRRVSEEIACLGFDSKHQRLVEIHVISDMEQMKGNGKLSFLERAWNASTLQSHCFQKILTAAEDDGLFYYATDVNEGEFLTDYIVRNGPVTEPTALAMALDLIDSLVEVEPYYRLLLGLRLKGLMVVLENSAYLTLRIIDLGLGRPEPRGMNEFEMTEVLSHLSQQLYYLLAGRPYPEGQPAVVEQLASVAPAVRKLLSDTIDQPTSKVDSFEKYQELLTDCYEKTTNGLPRRSAITATPKTRPRLTIQREIFERINFKTQLESASFTFNQSAGVFEFPYSVQASRSGNGEKGRLSWIPPRGVFPNPPQDEGLILLSGFYYRFLSNVVGISLQEFLILRNHRPSVIDVILLLNALAQKVDSGAVKKERFSFHQVWFDFPGKTKDEISAITKTGVDKWPALSVRILPKTETSVLLNPQTLNVGTPLLFSFINVANELLCEYDDAVHDFLDRALQEADSESTKYDTCGSFLVELADQLDKSV